MKIQARCEIAAPRHKVFETFSDLENLSKNVSAITRVELLTGGDIGVGTRFKETRLMFGKESSEVMEISEFVNPEHFREEAWSNGMHYISEWRFREIGRSTEVSITFTGKATTFIGAIMGIVFSCMAGSMKKAFLTDMEELKHLLESKP